MKRIVLKLEEKYENLKEFNKIKEIDPPEHLQSIFRPYQVSGYQWLNYLNEVNWGGILADDMGFGKQYRHFLLYSIIKMNMAN